MTKVVLLIAVTSSLLLASCTTKNETASEEIITSGVADQFRGYSLGIQQDIRFISTPQGQQIEFVVDSVGAIQFRQPQPDSIKAYVNKTRATFRDLGIVSFYTLNNNVAFIFTNKADSSYADVVKSNKNYVDKSLLPDDNPETTPYRYAYVYVYPGKSNPGELERLRRTHTVFRLKENWYYFRAFSFKQYNEF